MNSYINYKKSKLHYKQFASGSKLLFAFHGFGEEAGIFEVLEPALNDKYKIIAIDLPFHGKTQWNNKELFGKKEVADVIRIFLQKEKKSSFSLMGYSLGAKIILNCLEDFESQIKEMFLIAPDGIRKNKWYNYAVYTWWGRKIFKRIIEKPGKFFTVTNLMFNSGLLNQSTYKFVRSRLNTKAQREMVYNVWMIVRDFEANMKKFKSLINQYHIKTYLFFGRHDRIFTPKLGKNFHKGLKNSTLVILEKGHKLLSKELNEEILNIEH